jgi:hypothetical protein
MQFKKIVSENQHFGKDRKPQHSVQVAEVYGNLPMASSDQKLGTSCD